MTGVRPSNRPFDVSVETLIVGAGAAGLVAALASGPDTLVIERDAMPAGSTALSAGLIPAAGTPWQRTAGVEDAPEILAADIMRKAAGEPDPALVDALAREAGPTVEWLAGLGFPFELVGGFDYPGHSRRRMHGLPSRTGRELVDRLRALAEARDVPILCGARAETLFAEGGRVEGVGFRRPDGSEERVGCGRLILACNGFGGDRERVRRHMPAIADALWFGHDGNRGEALGWGEALGAATRHLGAYQGHGNVAHPHGILVTWAVVMEGGVQLNARGERFWDESQGYSEAARAVLAQPGGVAWTVFDERIAGVARQFEDYRRAEAAGAVPRAETPEALAAAAGLPPAALARTLAGLGGPDPFGRDFAGRTLAPPYRAVRVTGALFHTQGGLEVDPQARVRRASSGVFPNLLAAGGAACGVSGSNDAGYLSGNGLLSAVVLGRIAGLGARAA